MTWFRSKVKVTFIDDATGASLGVTRMPPGDLPETFESQTDLQLNNIDWHVVDAQPKTRAEYSKSKTLTLRLRRIETVDPTKILFSLPSICDYIPATGDQPRTGREYVLAEDDWRQFELVSSDLAEEAEAEIAEIRRIHETATAGAGWRKVHVRSKPEPPIRCDLQLTDLARALNASTAIEGVTYHDARTRIADGYSLTTQGGLTLYGVAPGGNVQVIACDPYTRPRPGADAVDLLRKLASECGLDLVQWCRCIRVASDDPLFGTLVADDQA